MFLLKIKPLNTFSLYPVMSGSAEHLNNSVKVTIDISTWFQVPKFHAIKTHKFNISMCGTIGALIAGKTQYLET